MYAEAQDNDELENAVVIYNRVPKTASTSFVGLVYDLCKHNKYHVLHINVTNNMHTLTLANQVLYHTLMQVLYQLIINIKRYNGNLNTNKLVVLSSSL